MFTTNARASSIGDAFTLARAFSKNFAKLADPRRRSVQIGVRTPQRPRRKPAPTECAAWGAGPGAAGFISDKLGLLPEMTRQSAPAVSAPQAE